MRGGHGFAGLIVRDMLGFGVGFRVSGIGFTSFYQRKV